MRLYAVYSAGTMWVYDDDLDQPAIAETQVDVRGPEDLDEALAGLGYAVAPEKRWKYALTGYEAPVVAQ